MTFGFSAECDFCGRTEHVSDVATAAEAVTELRQAGWHIDPDTTNAPALCPQCHAKEDTNADLGPASPKFYPPPGDY